MLTSNNKWYAGIAIVIAALLVSLTLFAQNQSKKNNSMNHTYDSSWWNSNIPEKYRLSDDQINQANKIRTEYNSLIQPEIEKLNSMRGDFSDYRRQDDISSKRIREYQKQLRDIEDNIYSLKVEAAGKIRNVLSKSQKPYYNNYIYNDWCYDWGWNYTGYMGHGMKDEGYMDCGWGWGSMGSRMRNHGRMNSRSGCW